MIRALIVASSLAVSSLFSGGDVNTAASPCSCCTDCKCVNCVCDDAGCACNTGGDCACDDACRATAECCNHCCDK